MIEFRVVIQMLENPKFELLFVSRGQTTAILSFQKSVKQRGIMGVVFFTIIVEENQHDATLRQILFTDEVMYKVYSHYKGNE